MKVFLGGSCNGSTWRDDLIPLLEIGYFNPVVKNWTPECQAEEILQRETCDVVLYTIDQIGSVYSIAEVVDDSNKRLAKTVFCLLTYNFDATQAKHMKKVADLVASNGATVVYSLKEAASELNSRARQ